MKIQEQKLGKLKEDDRLELASLLVKAGYKVQLGREKLGTSTSYNHFIEIFGDKEVVT
ncbi:MAG: resolvase [Eubacteriales bacterium]